MAHNRCPSIKPSLPSLAVPDDGRSRREGGIDVRRVTLNTPSGRGGAGGGGVGDGR